MDTRSESTSIASRHGMVLDSVVLLLLAAGLGTFLHWEAFTDPDRFHDNWRQSPHWISPERQQFQPDDVFIRYAEFNTSPFANLLYKTLALTGQDIFWGKFNAVLFFALGGLTVYFAGRALGGRLSGWLAVLLYLCFPCSIKTFVGGYMSGLSLPLLALTVLVIARQRWWWTVPLVTLEFLVYPMVAIHSAMMLILNFFADDLRHLLDRERWQRKFLPLLLSAAACLVLLSVKYLNDDHGFGRLVDRTEIGNRIEFTKAGRSPIIPQYAVTTYLRKGMGSEFNYVVFVVVFLWLGKRMFRLPRGLYSLLFASVLLYWLADILLLRLYFPNRYMLRSIPLFFVLAAGYWLSLILTRPKPDGGVVAMPRTLWRRLAPIGTVVLLLAAGVLDHGDTLLPPGDIETSRYGKNQLYAALRELPGRPLIAAHPKLASELPLLTGKSQLITMESSHPWWTAHWDMITERTQDFFRAYYARDAAELRAVIDKHGVDYWVIDREHFRSKYLQKRRYHMQPFARWVSKNLQPSKDSLLRSTRTADRLYNGKRFFVVSSDNVLRALDELEAGSQQLENATQKATE